MMALALSLQMFAYEGETGEKGDGQPDPNRRPRVGVVLSGGGAKGVAHIGALRYLEELGIPVDYIVGTSIGSIIGGLYALGYSAPEMDSLVRAQNWDAIMKDDLGRREILFVDKIAADRYVVKIPYLNPKTFREETGKVERVKKGLLSNLPSSFVAGHNLYSLFTKLSVGYQDSIDFNTLPIPFACVAIDLNTKQEVVFHNGDIVEAIRSSMSIPGYFAPVRHGNQFLVDGGMINNFPVDVVKEMGADIVIGVDLHQYDKAQVKPVDNLGDMFGSMLSLMNGRKYHKGRSETNVIITPNTGDYGVLAFDDASIAALVDSGYVAATRQTEALQKLAKYEREMALVEAESFTGPSRADYVPRKAINISRDSVYVNQVSIYGTNVDDMRYLMEQVNIRPGETISGDEMDYAISEFLKTNAFSKITYAMAGQDSAYNLKIHFTPEKLHEFDLGFRFDSEEMAAFTMNFSLNKHILRGFKLDLSTKLSGSPYLSITGAYAFNPKWQFNVSAYSRLLDLDYYHLAARLANFDIGYMRGQADIQTTGRNHGLNVGVRFDRHRIHSAMVSSGTSLDLSEYINSWMNMASVFADFRVDSRDRSYFATRGFRMRIQPEYYLGGYSSGDVRNNPYFDFYFDMEGIIPLGSRLALIPQVYFHFIDNDNSSVFAGGLIGGYMPERYYFRQMPFVGVNHAYKIDNKSVIGRLDLRCRIAGQQYVTAMANYVHNWHDLLEFRDGYGFWGYALGYSFDTFIGPIGINMHWSDLSRKFGAYFTLGYTF